MTRLFLIRHGESTAQRDGFISGHDTCTGLSDLGRRQAAALRDRLLETGEIGQVDHLYTSIMERAIETAGILAPALGEVGPASECEWCEIHPGDVEGMTWQQIQDLYPVRGNAEDPFRARFPGAETWAEFYVRAGTRLRRVADEHPDATVVVAGHGGIIGASFFALGEMSMRASGIPTMEARNTSITEWRWTGTEWRLVRFNDAAHLAGL